ncbi:hypothetical protein QYE76_032042 [Lolium multiflorum]|uniref:Disease resistance R13L4/SHOC-2-like LRR domain-containing protein n=1 Tax=Lolium multiflorum TaxID=4521 RepID=A0AAD8QW34_LOLMU|nr:hypothetical protein QYE76_032042 [Lolium multiflorum]
MLPRRIGAQLSVEGATSAGRVAPLAGAPHSEVWRRCEGRHKKGEEAWFIWLLGWKLLVSESLQSLKLYGNLVKLPEWIQGFNNLVKLKLRSCRISEHSGAIQVLGNLPNLASLHLLKKSFKGEDVHPNFCLEMFLVVLELSEDNRLRSVKFEGGATPKLELLQVYLDTCDNSSLSGLPHLSSLKEIVLSPRICMHLAYFTAELALHPNRPVLKMK